MGDAGILSPLSGVGDAGWAGAGLGLLAFAGAAGWGLRMLRWIGRPADPVAATALGFAFTATALLAAGWCGLALPVIAWLLLMPGLLLPWRRVAHGLFRESGVRWRESRAMTLLAALLALVALAGTSAPPLIYDAVAYHLLLPQQYALAHKVFAMPHFMPTAFPFLSSGGYLWTFLLGGGWRAAGALNWAWLPIAALAAGRLAAASGGAGAVAVLGVCLIPITLTVATHPLADLPGAAFALLAVATAAVPGRRRWIMAGLLAGCAAATKYNAGAAALIGCAALLPFERRKILRPILGFLICFVLPISPLFFSNLFSFSAPFFPLLSGSPQSFLVSEWNRALATAPRTLVGALVWPVRLIWDGPGYMHHELTAVAAGLAGLYAVGRGPRLRLGLAMWIVWLAAYVGHWPLRYLLPVMGVSIALAAVAVARFRIGPTLLAAAMLVCAGPGLREWAGGIAAWRRAGVSAETWVAGSRWPSPSGAASAFIRDRLSPSAVLVPVFEAQVFWAGRRMLPSLMHDRPVIFSEAAAARSADDLAARLRHRGVTHLLIALNLDPVQAPQWLAWVGPRGGDLLRSLVADRRRMVYDDGVHRIVSVGLTGRAALR